MFSLTWAIFKDRWGIVCGAVMIVGVINAVFNGIEQFGGQVLAGNVAEPAVVVFAQIAFFAIRWTVQIWLTIGQTMVMLDIARGRPTNIGKLFGGGPFLVQSIIAMLLVTLIMGAVALIGVGAPAAIFGVVAQDAAAAFGGAMLGLLIIFVPVIVLSLMFSQVQVLIVDRGVSGIESLSLSREITNGNKMTLFIIGICLTGIAIGAVILGLIALCVGVIPALIGVSGYAALLFAVTYLMMTGQRIAATTYSSDPFQ